MRFRGIVLPAAAVALCTSVMAQQPAPAAPAQPGGGGRGAQTADAGAPLRVLIYAGLKTHAPGQHDYPQFLADWSKILTERGAYVTGGLQFPAARELASADVLVIYKGDAGYLAAEDRAALDSFMRRGGGIVTHARRAVRPRARSLRRHRRRRQEARRSELHARSRRAVHHRRHRPPDHAGHVQLLHQGRSVLQHDLVEGAGDQGAGDGDDGGDAERQGARGRSRAADLDL